MMRKITFVGLTCLATFIVGCGDRSADVTQQANSVTPTTELGEADAVPVEGTADYPTFDSLENLAAKSTAMVRGTVTSVGSGVPNGPGVLNPQLAKENPRIADWVSTPVTFTVTELLAGEGFRAGSTVKILQRGGAIGSRSTPRPSEVPEFVKGQRVVLFLMQVTDGPHDINAILVGAGQGAYLYDADDRLQPARSQPGSGDVDSTLRGAASKEVATRAKAVIGRDLVPVPDPPVTSAPSR